jgi:hypothetical protein
MVLFCQARTVSMLLARQSLNLAAGPRRLWCRQTTITSARNLLAQRTFQSSTQTKQQNVFRWPIQERPPREYQRFRRGNEIISCNLYWIS